MIATSKFQSMNREFISKIRYTVSQLHFEDPLNEDYSTPEDWESIDGELYEQKGDEYVYLKRDDLDTLLDSNSVKVGTETDVNLNLGDELDLNNVDNINLSVS